MATSILDEKDSPGLNLTGPRGQTLKELIQDIAAKIFTDKYIQTRMAERKTSIILSISALILLTVMSQAVPVEDRRESEELTKTSWDPDLVTIQL